MPKILFSALFKISQIFTEFYFGNYLLVYNTAVVCVVTQRSSHKQAVKEANEHRRSANVNALGKNRSTSFRHTPALTCARPCFSTTEVALSVISTDLLLSLIGLKTQIMTANNFLKRENCFLLSSHLEQNGS